MKVDFAKSSWFLWLGLPLIELILNIAQISMG